MAATHPSSPGNRVRAVEPLPPSATPALACAAAGLWLARTSWDGEPRLGIRGDDDAVRPLRLDYDPEEPAAAWLHRVEAELARPARGPEPAPAFGCVFRLRPGPPSEPKGPIELGLSGDGSDLEAWYDPDRGSRPPAAHVAAHVARLAGALAGRPATPIGTLPLVTDAERGRILDAWNATAADYPRDSRLHDLFERHADRQPDAPAVLFAGRTVTYGELRDRARRVAAAVQKLGAGPGTLVALCAERSLELVTGMLGILEAGAAFVPVEPGYPAARTAFLLEDSGARIVATQRSLRHRLPDVGAVVLELDGELPGTGRADGGAGPRDLAYVIYTSGSTGEPKGIAIEHTGVVNNLVDLDAEVGLGPGDRVVAVSALGFDMCVFEVLGTLAAGATIVMPAPGAGRDPDQWLDLVERHGVSVWNSAPALLDLLVRRAEARPAGSMASLRAAILGGDWVPLGLPGRFRAQAPGARVVVLGGATEASIHSTIFHLDELDPTWTSIPYGRPMRNQRAYVLDARGELLPVGVPGELCLAGVGLARGYHRRDTLTQERFRPDPYGSEPGARLYRTGDLARWREDGNLELLGRIDFQVKLRGNRVELGEVEAALRRVPNVQEAVVAARGDRDAERELVAWVLPSAQWLRERDRERVDQWRAVYAATYAGRSDAAPGQDFTGWRDSYDGAAFPQAALEEMVEGAVGRILELRPRRVLEIGCGTGLILSRLAQRVEFCLGTDVSGEALERLRSQLARLPGVGSRVRLELRAAHELGGLDGAPFDTIVLNSVVQHFPSAAYLLDVLAGCTRLLAPGGRVFVGDVRHAGLLRAFHTSIELHRAPDELDVAELRERVRRRRAAEKEFAVEPDFFHRAARLLGYPGVATRLLAGRTLHEFTRFHYDVVLDTDASRATREPGPRTAWPEAGLAGVESMLSEPGRAELVVTGVPNGRIETALQAADRLGEPGPGSAGGLRRAIDAVPGIDPHALHELAQRTGYRADLVWSASEGRLDAWFVRDPVDWPVSWRVPGPGDAAPEVHAPAGGQADATLEAALREAARRWLPDYMVPSRFVIVAELPLTPNGKLDRRALPEPPAARPRASGRAPEGALERLVAWAFADALRCSGVGADEDLFTELGGHSLTALQIEARLREALGFRVPLASVLEAPSVAGLSSRIEALARAEGTDPAQAAETFLEVAALSEVEVHRRLESGDAGR